MERDILPVALPKWQSVGASAQSGASVFRKTCRTQDSSNPSLLSDPTPGAGVRASLRLSGPPPALTGGPGGCRSQEHCCLEGRPALIGIIAYAKLHSNNKKNKKNVCSKVIKLICPLSSCT